MGRVTVNGEVVTECGRKVHQGEDLVCLDGKEVRLEEKAYYLFHKPRYCLTTLNDPFGKVTIMQWLLDIPERVYPVGRLDYDTDGVLLLTNDGEFAYRLTHPKFEIPRTYRVEVEGVINEEAVRRLGEGVDIGDERETAPAKVRVESALETGSVIHLTLHEGRKREVKRMCEAVGHPVVLLTRTDHAGIGLENLKPGDYRKLKTIEIEKLCKFTIR